MVIAIQEDWKFSLEPESNRETLQRLDEILSGPVGIVYLMFLGRETYTAMIQDLMVNAGIYRKTPSVNQAVKRLLAYGSEFLIFQGKRGEKGKPGRKAHMYTASLPPIFMTLKAFDIDFGEKELLHVLACLSVTTDFFPQYLVSVFEISTLHRSAWHITLANYFHFISEIVLRAGLDPQIANRMGLAYFGAPVNIPILTEQVNPLIEKYPNLAKRLRTIALRMSLPKTGLNSALFRGIIENLPNIDETFLRMIAGFTELEDSLRMLRSKNIESLVDYIDKIRETEEFLKWKLEKENRELR